MRQTNLKLTYWLSRIEKKLDKEKKEKITRNKENKRSKERTTFRKMRSLLFDCRRERGEQEGKAKEKTLENIILIFL